MQPLVCGCVCVCLIEQADLVAGRVGALALFGLSFCRSGFQYFGWLFALSSGA
eukprot:m.419255 g.419255  ORF g.419255 m.419255 type:complete len:53 (+) comp56627_c0_seq25:2437-2595(+)